MRVWVLWLALIASALATPFRVEVKAEKTRFELGQTVKLVYRIEGPPQGQVVFPDAGKLELKPFEVKDAASFALPATAQGRVWEYRVKLTSYETGNLQLPEAHLSVKSSLDGTSEDLKLPGLRFEVERVPAQKGDKPDQIRDLKSLALAGVPWVVWIAAVLAALTGAATVWGLLRWLRNPRKVQAPPPLAPYPWALKELQELSQIRHDGERFYERLSYLLRFYLGWRYSLPLLEQTTSETMRVLQLPDPGHRYAKEILEAADMAKFARVVPPGPRLEEHLDWARLLVESHAPPEPVTGAKA